MVELSKKFFEKTEWGSFLNDTLEMVMSVFSFTNRPLTVEPNNLFTITIFTGIYLELTF